MIDIPIIIHQNKPMSNDIVNQVIRIAVNEIIAASNPKKIILFGSQARGDATEYSDSDILVIEDTLLPKGKRTSRYMPRIYSKCSELLNQGRFSLQDCPDIDLLSRTPDEFELSKHSPLSFASSIESEGKVLYGSH